jgi:hypothetical protein
VIKMLGTCVNDINSDQSVDCVFIGIVMLFCFEN